MTGTLIVCSICLTGLAIGFVVIWCLAMFYDWSTLPVLAPLCATLVLVIAAALAYAVAVPIASSVDPGWNANETPCTICSQILPRGATYCPNCGNAQQEHTAGCTICGAPLATDWTYCITCGTKVDTLE